VYDGQPHTDDWYKVRRTAITATDLPMILGLSKYGNALTVWRSKRNESAADDTNREAAEWGTILEEPVAQRWASQNGTTVRPVGVLANSHNPWMVASLDRLVDSCPDGSLRVLPCGLEVKTRSAYVAGKWREDVPDDVLAQVQWQLMVSGLPHAHVACLLGGQKLVSYTVARDKQLEDYLMAAALEVWESVQNNTPPPVSADAEGVLIRELNAMFAKREGARRLEGAELDKAEEHITRYRAGGRLMKNGKREVDVAKGNLIKMLGGAEMATGPNDEPLFTYKRPDAKYEMTAAQRARLEKERPELHAELVAEGYITKNDPNPRFNLK
jgi:putative phage-type endonuclease